MISQLLLKWFQSSLKDADPEKVRSWFYLAQVGAGGLIVFGVYWLRQREAPSGFRVREADLKKDIKNSIGKKPDPLAQARYAKKEEPLRLGGISIHGEPHEILGVQANATEAEIRAAYRERMKQYHPDRIGRPGSREWQDAQKIAEAINLAKDHMLSKSAGRPKK
jgi:DnaJ-domain-containing protein 1